MCFWSHGNNSTALLRSSHFVDSWWRNAFGDESLSECDDGSLKMKGQWVVEWWVVDGGERVRVRKVPLTKFAPASKKAQPERRILKRKIHT